MMSFRTFSVTLAMLAQVQGISIVHNKGPDGLAPTNQLLIEKELMKPRKEFVVSRREYKEVPSDELMQISVSNGMLHSCIDGTKDQFTQAATRAVDWVTGFADFIMEGATCEAYFGLKEMMQIKEFGRGKTPYCVDLDGYGGYHAPGLRMCWSNETEFERYIKEAEAAEEKSGGNEIETMLEHSEPEQDAEAAAEEKALKKKCSDSTITGIKMQAEHGSVAAQQMLKSLGC